MPIFQIGRYIDIAIRRYVGMSICRFKVAWYRYVARVAGRGPVSSGQTASCMCDITLSVIFLCMSMCRCVMYMCRYVDMSVDGGMLVLL